MSSGRPPAILSILLALLASVVTVTAALPLTCTLFGLTRVLLLPLVYCQLLAQNILQRPCWPFTLQGVPRICVTSTYLAPSHSPHPVGSGLGLKLRYPSKFD